MTEEARSDPFAMTANPAEYVPRTATERALEMLAGNVGGGAPIVVLSGPAGLGKTLLLHLLAVRLRGRRTLVYLPYAALPPGDVCLWALAELGEAPRNDAAATLSGLARDFAARGAPLVLVLDEGSAIPLETARRLAALTSELPGALSLLVAVTDDAKSEAVVAALGRTARSIRLEEPLSAEESAAYIAARLERAVTPANVRGHFDAALLDGLHRAARGVPRVIHRLASEVVRLGPEALFELELDEPPFEREGPPEIPEALDTAPAAPEIVESARPSEPALPESDDPVEPEPVVHAPVEVPPPPAPAVPEAPPEPEPEPVMVPLPPTPIRVEELPPATEPPPVLLEEPTPADLILVHAEEPPAFEPTPIRVEEPEPVESTPVRVEPPLPEPVAPPAPEPEPVTSPPPRKTDWPRREDTRPQPAPTAARGISPVQIFLVALAIGGAAIGIPMLLGRSPDAPPRREELAPLPPPAPASAPVAPVPPSPAAPTAMPAPTKPAPVVEQPKPAASTPAPPQPTAMVAPVKPPEPPAKPAGPPVSVAINATPWATVEIDGREVGDTPLAGISVPAGSHVFRAKMPGGRVIVRTVEVDAKNRFVTFH